MEQTWKVIIWRKFEAAIDTPENALRLCPEELWQARLWDERDLPDFAEFWYIAYHTLFWLDFYLSESAGGFAPPAPFTLSELDAAGLLPDRVYSRDELLTYLEYGRQKCRERIETLSDEMAPQRLRANWRAMSIAELLL